MVFFFFFLRIRGFAPSVICWAFRGLDVGLAVGCFALLQFFFLLESRTNNFFFFFFNLRMFLFLKGKQIIFFKIIIYIYIYFSSRNTPEHNMVPPLHESRIHYIFH